MTEAQMRTAVTIAGVSPTQLQISASSSCQSCRSCLGWMMSSMPTDVSLAFDETDRLRDSDLLDPGSSWQLLMPTQSMLSLTSMIYGLPLVSFLGGMWFAAAYVPSSEVAAIFGAIAGFTAGLLYSFRWLRKREQIFTSRLSLWRTQ